MNRFVRIAALAVTVVCGMGAAPAFDPKPWLEDLEQTRDALQTGYANLDWAVHDREANMPALFDEAADRLKAAKNESDARAALERFGRRIGDGHIAFLWKSSAEGGESAAGPCDGYNKAYGGTPVAANMPGYRPLADSWAEEFSAGLVTVGKARVGVIRIGLFMPQAWPALCEAAAKAFAIPTDKPCDDDCNSRISTWTNARMAEDFMLQLRALRAAGAQAVLVDIANNSGGSEWAEGAALALTAKPLQAERVDFVRTKAWAGKLADDEKELRFYADKASGEERTRLLAFADQIHAKAVLASQPCDGAKLWAGETTDCHWLGAGFYATGLLAHADVARWRGKPYGEMIYSPAQSPFEAGVWTGPLIVLVDRNSYSAAEEFAAVLQDNRAAIIIGEPTGGAGCGHMLEGAAVTLKNSGATLQMPDCSRMRADGSNEIRGIQPDVLVGFTPRDGAKLKGQRLLEKLGAAVALAMKPR